MKPFALLFLLLFSVAIRAQTRASLPHGTVYGVKPYNAAPVPATKLEDYMGAKTRITATIEGKVIKVTRSKGGWFTIDAGNGKIINAHFKVYNITIPASLAGHTVIVEGVAQKQFIADDSQHLAGDTVVGKKQHTQKTNPKKGLSFEATGLLVDK